MSSQGLGLGHVRCCWPARNSPAGLTMVKEEGTASNGEATPMALSLSRRGCRLGPGPPGQTSLCLPAWQQMWPGSWALGPCVPALVLATVGLSRPRALTFSFPARFTSSAAPPPAPLRSWRRAPRHAALGLRVSLGWDTVGAGGFILTSAGLFWLLGNQGLETRLYAPPPLPRTATSLHPPQQSCRAPEPRELSRARGLRGLLQAGASAEDHRYQGCGLTLRPWPPVLPGDARPPCRQETGSFSSARCDHKGPGGGDRLEGPRSALQGFKPLLSGRVPQEH